jgi:hypothetical protein
VLGTILISGLCFGASYIGAGQLWTWLQKCVMAFLFSPRSMCFIHIPLFSSCGYNTGMALT